MAMIVGLHIVNTLFRKLSRIQSKTNHTKVCLNVHHVLSSKLLLKVRPLLDIIVVQSFPNTSGEDATQNGTNVRGDDHPVSELVRQFVTVNWG